MSDYLLLKNVILDLMLNKDQRPLSELIDITADPDWEPATFVEKFYCANPSQGRFIITRFVMYREEKKLVLEWENSTTESGGGAVIGYHYKHNGDVEYAHLFNAFYV